MTGALGFAPERMRAKCRWLARHEPDVWRRTRWVMTISDYLTYGLTGVRAGDASTAAHTGLYSLPARAWWPIALGTFGIGPDQLSSPLTPGTRCGHTAPRAGTLLNLPAGIPFAVGALDHHAPVFQPAKV